VPRKKSSPRRPTQARPLRAGKDPATAKQIQHYNAVLIESLESNFKFVIEKVDGMESRLNQRIDEERAKNDERFDRIESVLSYHSGQFKRVDSKLKEIESKLAEHDARFTQIDARFDRLESKLDTVITKVADHEQILKQRIA
jgi:chromosome segregation ATPase